MLSVAVLPGEEGMYVCGCWDGNIYIVNQDSGEIKPLKGHTGVSQCGESICI